MKFIAKITKNTNREKGFSTIELVIVALIISIVALIAVPQIMNARRLMRFSGLQRQISTTLRNARQEAMSQRTPITVIYDDAAKKMSVSGGKFGAVGTQNNTVFNFADEGLATIDVTYGKPSGASASALGDGSNVELLVAGKADITFQADGAVVDAGNNPQNKALFFYESQNPTGMAFAISVLGAGGRVKIWKYASGSNNYVE
jgi:Tfp pilus assembly protein FimT